MTLRVARRSPRWCSLSLFVGLVTVVAALISGCCTNSEEDVCMLFDESMSCPGRAELAEMIGAEDVTDGPEQRQFYDLRSVSYLSTVDGNLCCYHVKRQTCSRIGSVY